MSCSVHQWKQNISQLDVQTHVQSLANAVRNLRNDLGQRRGIVYNDPQIDEVEEGGLMYEIESCLKSAENLVNVTKTTASGTFEGHRSSTPSGDVTHAKPKAESGTKEEENVRHLEIRPKETVMIDPFIDGNTKHRGSTDSDQDSDPEPDFDEELPPVVYSELITTLLQESHREFQATNYHKAEIAHCKAIKYLTDRESKLDIPFDNRSQTYEMLAEMYVKMKKFDKAKAIVTSLLKQENVEMDHRWRLYHTLAGIYLAQDRLTDAEKFARRAYIGREKALGKGHALIIQSADLLVLIYERLGETQAAQVFRNLYPNEKIVAQAPQVSKHVGTKRVNWNPDLSVDVNALTKSGKTLLIHAISSGDDDRVHQVLQTGADVEVRCEGGMTPLMYAIIHGQERIAGVLLSRGAQVDATTSGWTTLHKAVDLGDWKMARLLLDNGADMEARGPKKFAPNKGSANRRESRDTCSADEDTDSDDENGWTALLRAADCGKEPMVHTLLDQGADMEARNPNNGTPLACAAENQHQAVVDLLLLRGADANAADDFGWRPLHRSQVHRGGDEVAFRLLNGGADVNAKCMKDKTPLHYAIERENGSMVHLLLEAGADIGATDIAKRTPLHTAIECRLESMVHLLLESGADASVKDSAGHDALASANHALRKSPEIVKLLSKHIKAKKKVSVAVDLEMKSPRMSSTLSSRSGSTAGTSSQGLVPSRSPSSWWSRHSKKPK